MLSTIHETRVCRSVVTNFVTNRASGNAGRSGSAAVGGSQPHEGAGVFVLVTSRVLSADRLAVELRGEHVGTLDGAKRHAVTLAQAVAERFGVASCCDVQSIDGLPLFFVACVAGGAR